MNASWIIEVTDETFEREVVERSREVPVVVDFWAPWCAPCRALAPVLERLVQEGRGRWVLAKVNTDQNPLMPQRYGVQGIPAVKAFVDGRLVAEFTGAIPEPEVRRWLGRFVPSDADIACAQAEREEQAGRLEQAESLYRQALDRDPRHPGARLGLARAALRRGKVEEAKALLEDLDTRGRQDWATALADLRLRIAGTRTGDLDALEAKVRQNPSDPEARYEWAMALAARQRYEDALEHLLHLVKTDRSFRDDGARKAMIEIFEAVGPRSDLAERWRERLAAALYR